MRGRWSGGKGGFPNGQICNENRKKGERQGRLRERDNTRGDGPANKKKTNYGVMHFQRMQNSAHFFYVLLGHFFE